MLVIKEIDKEHRKNMARILGGATLEVGSYFIPGTIGAKSSWRFNQSNGSDCEEVDAKK